MFAQDVYPDRRIKVIVAHPAGAPHDMTTRIIAEWLSKQLGVPIIIENILGASGMVGAHQCTKAKPDGYTLCALTTSQILLTPIESARISKKPPLYDENDFTPIAQVAYNDFVLVVRREVGETFEDVVRFALTHGLTVGWGNGNGANNTRKLASITSDRITSVPSQHGGEAASLGDVLGGHLQAAFVSVSTAMPYVNDPRIRVVGTDGSTRNPFLPHVKTLREQGYHIFGYSIGWTGFFGPSGLPTSITERLSNAIADALKDPGVVARTMAMHVPLLPAHSDELRKTIAKDAVALRNK